MVENLQREDLNAIDKATAFRDYLARYGGTQEELAGRLGLDRSTVSNLIRLLELPEAVLDGVRSNEISQGHARALLGSPRRRKPDRRLSPDHVGAPLRAPDRGPGHDRRTHAIASQSPQGPSSRRSAKSPHLIDLEQRLNDSLGMTVSIRPKTADRGQIIIDYQSRERVRSSHRSAFSRQPNDTCLRYPKRG